MNDRKMFRGHWRFSRLFCFVIVLCRTLTMPDGAFAQDAEARTPAATGQITGGAIATVHPIATDAGLQAFRSGGNAIDAAVAAAVMLGVVDSHNSGLGGGCFILIRTADGELIVIDGRESAPAAASRNMYIRDGAVATGLSTTGALAVATPGALAAYHQAVTSYGQAGFPESLLRAARVAKDGFEVNQVNVSAIARTQKLIRKFPATADVLLNAAGQPHPIGDTLRQPDLAATYRSIAAHGIKWFYDGPYAKAVSDWMSANGGLLRATDFRNYQTKLREPVIGSYRDHQIIGFPPPSSGGIHLIQMLNILEHFPLADLLKNDSAQAYHLIAEAMKLAYADRAYWLGDADFVSVPLGLTSKEYAATLAQRIDVGKAGRVATHGVPPNAQARIYDKHTTHISAVDDAGNWVAITTSINTTFGSKVMIPGTGLLLNNTMDDFSARPGQPNAFGLVGAEANSIASGKRPLSSMCPTIVTQDGQPVLTLGAAGGPRIITEVLLAIIHFIDGDLSLNESVAAARIHHQWQPPKLFVEKTFPNRFAGRLRKMGHDVDVLTYAGVTQAIARTSDGQFIGVADPRVTGKAAVWSAE